MAETAVIRIVDSLSGSPIVDLFGGLILHVRSPRSRTSVTVSVSSGILTFSRHHFSGPGRPLTHELSIPDHPDKPYELYFDLSNEPRHIVRLDGFQYEIRLLQIGHIEDEAYSWPWYEFEVTQHPPNLPADDA